MGKSALDQMLYSTIPASSRGYGPREDTGISRGWAFNYYGFMIATQQNERIMKEPTASPHSAAVLPCTYKPRNSSASDFLRILG